MRNRTRVIAAAAVAAALAAGSTGAAVASATGAKPGGSKAVGSKSAEERQGNDVMTAAVARELHVSTARASAALQPLFAAERADTSSSAFAAAARSLGVSTQQLNAALMHAKERLAATHPRRSPGGSKAAVSKAAERQAHDVMTAAVARELHVSAARVGAALRPLFAAGRADTSSPAFVAAARSLGVSTHQLNTALMRAKQSLAQGS
jgi:predicted 2-oxoglutarate/Fe(II)-dependent dioxygenase YbiX